MRGGTLAAQGCQMCRGVPSVPRVCRAHFPHKTARAVGVPFPSVKCAAAPAPWERHTGQYA